MEISRRNIITGASAVLAATAATQALAAEFVTSQRFPDPAIEILDPKFGSYLIVQTAVERVATGILWAEGPAWFGDMGAVLFSDVQGNAIMKWDEATGRLGTYRKPSNYSNGNARDRQGRLITCEHATNRITRTELDGSITPLADSFDGKPLNSPNDIVCKSDGSIWFTDPAFGPNFLEGSHALTSPMRVYRWGPDTGKLTALADDIIGPNGLAFSPDEKVLYVVEARSTPTRHILAYDVVGGNKLANKRVFIDAGPGGTPDGLRIDIDGNLWCGWGMGAGLDGVHIYNPQAKLIGRIALPERCANLCFAGPNRNRLIMTASTSLYSLKLNTQGAKLV